MSKQKTIKKTDLEWFNRLLITRLKRYEDGELNSQETHELFQELLDTYVVWNLDWSYLETMKHLIRDGLVKVNVKENNE